MASHSLLLPHSSPFPKTLTPNFNFNFNLKTLTSKSPKLKFKFRSIKSQIQSPDPNNKEENNDNNKNKTPIPHNFNFLNLSVTLTIISASLPQPAAAATATTKGKKRVPKKSSTKKLEALSPEELKSWNQGLPMVSDRIPYSEIIELRKNGKLKHIIKPATVKLRQRAEAIFVVLDDNRVFRTVLPSIESHSKFWDSWDELKVDSLCVNAFTPPIKKPDLEPSVLANIWIPPIVGKLFDKLFDEKPKKESKRLLELRQQRMELKLEKERQRKMIREEREMMEKSMRIQRKEEERRRKMEIRKRKYQESLREARQNYLMMADFWSDLAMNPNVANALGLLFFYIFYRVVVLNYRKQKKDYEDRLKIEKAEAEERRKMRELEREMEGLEAGDDIDESEQGKGEDNPYLKMAKQFMRSGARVRRAQNRRLPQYLERGVDVKFTDVAGLGKIRLELEEIVKFFTHGDMYRRRGVKIPGLVYLNSLKH